MPYSTELLQLIREIVREELKAVQITKCNTDLAYKRPHEYRRMCNKSQKEVCKRIGIYPARLSKLENGYYVKIPMNLIRTVAQVLNISAEEYLLACQRMREDYIANR